MKLLFYYINYGTPMTEWVMIHIIDELAHHECDVEIINPLDFESVSEANECVLKRINECKYDLFFTPHNEKMLYIETLEKIKDKEIPTLLICFDNLIVPFKHFVIAPHFDLVWLTSKETEYMFKQRDCNTVFLPYAANPYLARETESIQGIGFLGSPYGSRANMINELTEQGIDVYCHCKNDCKLVNVPRLQEDSIKRSTVIKEFLSFPQGRKVIEGALVNKLKKQSAINENDYLHYESTVTPKQVYTVYSRYALALSSTSARNTGVLRKPLDIVNLRAFEIPMSGGIQFCRYSNEISTYFKDGTDIVLYKNEEEMIEKARYYLKDENRTIRDRIRLSARHNAEVNHTWWCRFSRVFEQLRITV